MTIQINIIDELESLDKWIGDIRIISLSKALKRSLLRTGKTLQKEANQEIRKHIALKAKDIRTIWFKYDKRGLKTKRIDKMGVVLMVKDKPIPFIMLVRGSKTPKSQKGIKVKRRKAVKVKLKPGKSVRVRGGFLAKGPKSGAYNVFRRESVRKGPIVAQSAPSIHLTIQNKVIMNKLEKSIGKKFQKQFVNQLKNAISKQSKTKK